MNLKIIKVQEDYKHNDLMYEVLVDQNSWAVCGRSAGKLYIAINFCFSVLI